MYTRSRQSQNFTGGTPQRQGGYQGGNQNFNQGGNYQGGNQNQQAKQGTPFKQQPQQGQPQTPQNQQQAAARLAQQQQMLKQQQQAQQQQAMKAQPGTPQQQAMKPQQGTPQQQGMNQQQMNQQSTPQPQRLKPILKGMGTAQNQVQPQNQGQQNQVQNQNSAPLMNQGDQQNKNGGMEYSESSNIEDGNAEGQEQVPRWKRKIPGLKVNRKLKRLKMNQRLRKQLQPKNAIMVLNEMKSGVQFTFPENTSNLPGSLFLVHANVDGKTYVGQGISKLLARQNAAENALKSLLLEKMTAAAMKASEAENADGQPKPDGEPQENPDGTPMETNVEEQDEIPWSSLASFALYKLFIEWQNQGTVVPIPRPGVSPGRVKREQKPPAVPKELPPNPLTIHPVMLLNQMRPGLTYTEVSRQGTPPNIMFTLGVDIDGRQFTGSAKNKKDAKKLAARSALNGLFGLVYPDEPTPMEDATTLEATN